MPTTLQFRRGTQAQNNSFTGASGEITFDVTNKTLRVHDGVTAGGHRLGTFAEVVTAQNQAAGLDSAAIVKISIDSARTVGLIDSAYINARADANIDSAALIILVENELKLLDSDRGTALIDARVDAKVNANFINNLTIDADTLAGQNGAYYRAYSNLTGKPTIPSLGNSFVDSAETLKLIDANALDSARAQSLISVPKFGTDYIDSATAITLANTRITANIIDEDNMSSNSATRAPSQQSVKAYVDAEVSGLVASAPGALNTLNELAAAIGDDANFSTTITNSIAAKLDSALATQLIDSAYVQARTTAGTDSAATISLINNTINAFKTISVAGQDNVVADTSSDTLTFTAGSNMTITTNANGDAITFTAAGGGGGGDITSVIAGKGLLGGAASGDVTLNIDSDNIKSFMPQHGTDYVDSAITNTLADARITATLIDEDNMSSNSATRLPSQQSVKAYVDAQTLSLIDEDNMSTNSATRPPSQQSVKAYVDAVNHDNLTGFVANEHIDHTSVSIATGDGLSGGGTIASTRTLKIDSSDLAGLYSKVIVHDNTSGFVANEHIDHSGVSITAGKGLSGGGTIASTRTLNIDSANIISFTTQHLGTDFVDSGETLKLIGANALDSARSLVQINALKLLDSSRALHVAETEFSVTTASGSVYKFTGDGFPSQSGNNPTLYFTRGKRYVIHNSSYSSHPLYIKTTPGTGTGNQQSSGTAGQGSVKVTFDVPMDAPKLLYYQCSAHAAMHGTIVILSEASAVDSAQVSGIIDSDYVNIRSLKGLSVSTASASGGGTLAYNNVTGVFTFAPSTNSGGGGGLDSALAIQLIDSSYVQARSSGGGGGLDSALTTKLIDSSYVQARTETLPGPSLSSYEYFATNGQTIFSGNDVDGSSLSFATDTILVHHNGILLKKTNDYIESAGNNRITLTSAADSDDILTVSVFAGGGGNAGITAFKYEADSAQTTFGGADLSGATLGYTVGKVQVHLNGILLTDSDDYTASNGTQVVLTSGADSADIISISAFSGKGIDSAKTIALIDSDYVQARVAGGTDWQPVKTADYTAVAGQGVFVNSTGGTKAVTLPASPTLGDEVRIIDAYGTAATNNITIQRNNKKIMGADSNFVLDINRAAVGLVFVNDSQGWVQIER